MANRRKWTDEEKEAQRQRLKRYWSQRQARDHHSQAMKEHWAERKKRRSPAPKLTKQQRLDNQAALVALLSIKEFVERDVGTSLTVAQIANIICSNYARNHNVQS
jgi:hypothetical protein